ncbi:MAG: hypothetical protein ABJA81_03325 [Nocardioidaceae bacterium]
MQLRRVLVLLGVAAVGVVGVQGTASAAPLTRQSFSLTSPIDVEGGTVVASGAINATGEDVVVSDTEDLFIFPAGTLTVIHAPIRSHDKFNEKKCTFTVRETGVYLISEGTGAYEGVTGSGEYRFVAHGESSPCGSEPTGTLTITARGSINLPEG